MNIRAPNDIRNRHIKIQAKPIFDAVPTRQNLHNGDIPLQKIIVLCEIWGCNSGADEESKSWIWLHSYWCSVASQNSDLNLQH